MFFVFLANLRQIFLTDMHSTSFIILFNKIPQNVAPNVGAFACQSKKTDFKMQVHYDKSRLK